MPHFSDFFGLLHETAAISYINTERDNTRLSTNPFLDQYQSPESPGLDTPRTSTPNTHSGSSSPAHSFNIAPISFEADLAAARKLQSEWAQDDYSHELPPNDTTSATELDLRFPPVERTPIAQFELDYPPVDTSFSLDFLTAQRLQAEYDTELQIQESYARQVQHAEQQHSSHYDQDLAEARRLKSEWEAQDASAQQEVSYWQAMWQQEDQQMAAQVEFARGLVKEEEVREEGIKRDVEAAKEAQAQWEADALELEKQVKRATEEAERREAEQRRREAEAEAARRAEEERRARMADCVSCMEEGEKKDMCMLGCEHGYCGGCVAGSYYFPYLIPFPSSMYADKATTQKQSNLPSNPARPSNAATPTLLPRSYPASSLPLSRPATATSSSSSQPRTQNSVQTHTVRSSSLPHLSPDHSPSALLAVLELALYVQVPNMQVSVRRMSQDERF